MLQSLLAEVEQVSSWVPEIPEDPKFKEDLAELTRLTAEVRTTKSAAVIAKAEQRVQRDLLAANASSSLIVPSAHRLDYNFHPAGALFKL